jgi:S-DNA-T family DNA segregation ATPase FtsK/SpoIIIE
MRRWRCTPEIDARLVEQMEADGVVSAPQHNGNREVLAPPPPKN